MKYKITCKSYFSINVYNLDHLNIISKIKVNKYQQDKVRIIILLKNFKLTCNHCL